MPRWVGAKFLDPGHFLANFAPRPVARPVRRVRRGATTGRARSLHYDLHPLVDAAFTETNPVPAKWIMHQLGVLGSPRARAPLAPLSDAGRERVESLLAGSPHIDLPAVRRVTSFGRIQIVFSRRPDGVSEDDWNTWYDAHLHEILAIPGFVSAQRFAIDQLVGAGEGAEWTHIALYEVEGDFEQLAAEMIRMSLGSAEAYIELKKTDTARPAAAAVVGRGPLRLLERPLARRPRPRARLHGHAEGPRAGRAR